MREVPSLTGEQNLRNLPIMNQISHDGQSAVEMLRLTTGTHFQFSLREGDVAVVALLAHGSLAVILAHVVFVHHSASNQAHRLITSED